MPPASPSAAESTAKVSRSQLGEREAEGDRDRRLEDHRPGDVSQRQAVLPLADPEEAVRLLRQLGGQRGEDQREDERLDPDATSARSITSTTNRWAPPTIAPRPTTELEHDHVHARLVAGIARQDQRADRFRRFDLPAALKRSPDVDHIGAHEGEGQNDAHALRRPQAEDRRQGEEAEEEAEVAVERGDVRREPGAPARGAAGSPGRTGRRASSRSWPAGKGRRRLRRSPRPRSRALPRSRRRSGSASPASRCRQQPAGSPPLPVPGRACGLPTRPRW